MTSISESPDESFAVAQVDARGTPSAGTVSVVVTAFNVADYIRETLNSWVAQTYADLQIIVVDDASTDNTVAVVQECAQFDSRIQLTRHEANRGPNAARLSGLSAARGDFFIFCDGDDTVHPELVERCLRHCPDGVDCVFFRYAELDDRTGVLSCGGSAQTPAAPRPSDGLSSFELGQLRHIAPVCFFRESFRGSFFEVFTDFKPTPFFEDLPSFIAMIARCRINLIPDTLYYYRQNRPGQSIDGWWRGERALKYLGLIRAVEQAQRTGFLDSDRVRAVTFFKLLQIAFTETVGVGRHAPGELRRLKKLLFPVLAVSRRGADLREMSLRYGMFLALFTATPACLLPRFVSTAIRLSSLVKSK